jgi:hypothetical protein
MKKLAFPIIILVFSLAAGCASRPAASSAPAAEPAAMTAALESCRCGVGEFRGMGAGKTEGETFAQACDDFPQILWGDL